MERSYTTSKAFQTWQYDSSGALFHYQFAPRQFFVEPISVWFSREGFLIACEVDAGAFWMGRRVTTGEMFHYLAKYYRWPTYG